jgi:hypothetical protein
MRHAMRPLSLSLKLDKAARVFFMHSPKKLAIYLRKLKYACIIMGL